MALARGDVVRYKTSDKAEPLCGRYIGRYENLKMDLEDDVKQGGPRL